MSGVGPDGSDGEAQGGAGPDDAAMRAVLGRFASGVTVVSGIGPEGPVGFTCQSFFSLSLAPPLVALAPSRLSVSWPHMHTRAAFTASILTDRQEALARAFSVKGRDKFRGVGWAPGTNGAPRIQDALAWVDCRVERVHDGGDHHLVIGRILAIEVGDGEPLVFYRGGFGSFRA